MVILIAGVAAAVAAQPVAPARVAYPAVEPGRGLAFPRDHGAHPEFRLEWWYVTGWLETAARAPLGFQVTFFRVRPDTDPANPSAFAPKQILFAHAALSDPAAKSLVHDERAARVGFGIAETAEADAAVKLTDWSFVRRPDGSFHARIPAQDFALNLAFRPTQPVLAQGENGYSRKGPRPEQASHYYSIPQLAVRGTVSRGGKREAVTGRAWLDREWSSSLLDPRSTGWDWAGINYDDGSSLMAFRVRGADGTALWAGATLRRADGGVTKLGPGQVRFVPRRTWRSSATGAVYPVEAEFVLALPEGERRVPLKPLFDAQELDGRGGGLPAYWEGAVTTPGGRGYLELTGYAGRLRL